MALFGGQRDIEFMLKVNRELINNVIEQQVDYYKPFLPDTKSRDTANLYGEASAQKTWYQPVRLQCLLTYEAPQIISEETFGLDNSRIATFAFLREDLLPINLVPEIGDIIEYRNKFYELDQIEEKQFVLGKDKVYPKSVGDSFGRSISIIVTAHLSSQTRLQISKARL